MIASLLACVAEHAAPGPQFAEVVGPGDEVDAEPRRDPRPVAVRPYSGPISQVEPDEPDEPDDRAEAMDSVPMWGGSAEVVDGYALFLDAQRNRVHAWWDEYSSNYVPLGANARPFRLLPDPPYAWVTLRGTGELVRVTPSSWPTEDLRSDFLCAEPRGIARSPTGLLVVACAGGELIELDDDANVVRSVLLEPDLRDVVVADGVLWVSRFHAAELLLVDPVTLAVLERKAVVAFEGRRPNTAWRVRAAPSGGVDVVLQSATRDAVGPARFPDAPDIPYYGAPPPEPDLPPTCEALQQPTFAHVPRSDPQPPATGLSGMVLPVDFSYLDDGSVAVVDAAQSTQAVVVFTDPAALEGGDCVTGVVLNGLPWAQPAGVLSRPWGGPGGLLIYGVDPASFISQASLTDPGSGWDWGGTDESVDLFHNAINGIACASCHPEGEADGIAWEFGEGEGLVPGVRQTQWLPGVTSQRAPFHWLGDVSTELDLVAGTMVGRMGVYDGYVDANEAAAMFRWLDGLRVRRPALSSDALALVPTGEGLFVARGCAGCHTGAALTTNALEVVRPDGVASKVSSLLGVGSRTIFMRDGCAATLREALAGPEDCTGGDLHGDRSTLTDDDIEALVAYLQTL